MKYIIIDDEDKSLITTDLVSDLCNIELTQDIVICVPRNVEELPCEFYTNDFILRNNSDIVPNKEGLFSFFPRVKICIPEGLYLQFNCLINGLAILSSDIEKIQGVELDETLNLRTVDDNFKLDITAVSGYYTFYKKMTFFLKEYNREMFLNYVKNRHSGIRIPKNNTILNFYFLETFIGGPRKFYNDIYLIQSDFIYNNFPNFGTNVE